MGDATPPQKRQINLFRGWPNPSLLPTTAISTAAQHALSNPSVSTPGLLYGPDAGYQPLRESVSKWLSSYYGNETQASNAAGADRICVTGGASQNLACLLQVYSDPLVTNVWMVAPCYYLACPIFDDSAVRVRAVPEGSEGCDLEALERGFKECEKEGEKKPLKGLRSGKIYRHIVYCVPTFSNPSGKTMPLSTRESLIRLARRYDALIITDDVYDFLQWPISSSSPSTLSKAPLPRLVDIDRSLHPAPGPADFGNAVSNGSFSKIAGPGVRTGWAEATPKFVHGLSQCGSSRSGGAPSQLTATIMDSLLTSGDLTKHIETVLKPAYQKRYQLVLGAIKKELVPLGIKVREESLRGQDVFGGYFMWLELPSHVLADTVAQRAAEEELIVAPGQLFEVRGDESVKFDNSLRLTFAWEEENYLVEGVERLGEVIREVMDDDGSQPGRFAKRDFQKHVNDFK